MQKLGLSEGAKIAEILGVVAVVMSVIYLAIQISDNNRLLRSQAHFNALDLTQDPLKMTVENDGLASMIYQCDQAPNDVSPEIWRRCLNYYFIQYNGWEYVYYQNIDGSIPSQLWVGADAMYREQIKLNQAYARFWAEYQVGFDEPFKSYVSELFVVRSQLTPQG